jgi:carboxyl-terminal processing protease
MTGALLAFAAALTASSAHAAGPDDVRQAIEVIEATYGAQVDAAELYRAALQGIAVELDRAVGRPGHAILTETEHSAVDAWLDGHRKGIAAEFAVVAGQGIVITDVYPGGPASRAGLEIGDLVVAIDNHPFTGLPAELILGIAGTIESREVILDIRRPEGLRRVPVSRGPWRLDTARSFQHHDVSVLKLPFFGPQSARAVAAALADHPADASLVIDLRTNEGGRLDAMLDVASLFIPKGRPVVLVDHGTDQPTAYSARPSIEIPRPGAIVILVDRDTAGTAEAFAAALREESRAILVGSPTAGHAGLPRWVALDHGLTMQMMDDRLLGTGGETWASTGLIPDILSQPVSRTMPVRPGQVPPDVQLDVAVQVAERADTESMPPR